MERATWRGAPSPPRARLNRAPQCQQGQETRMGKRSRPMRCHPLPPFACNVSGCAPRPCLERVRPSRVPASSGAGDVHGEALQTYAPLPAAAVRVQCIGVHATVRASALPRACATTHAPLPATAIRAQCIGAHATVRALAPPRACTTTMPPSVSSGRGLAWGSLPDPRAAARHRRSCAMCGGARLSPASNVRDHHASQRQQRQGMCMGKPSRPMCRCLPPPFGRNSLPNRALRFAAQRL
ncbi:hypothetical protein K438DRAFT_1967190 [Mycena galopus ATCC 62051]|nr:hypothetical protein K438DRAFT_1967190 [Mycena galopus ATCC 62051]